MVLAIQDEHINSMPGPGWVLPGSDKQQIKQDSMSVPPAILDLKHMLHIYRYIVNEKIAIYG